MTLNRTILTVMLCQRRAWSNNLANKVEVTLEWDDILGIHFH